MSDPPPDSIQSLVDGGYQLSIGVTPQVAYYYMNFKNEFGSNKLVRQAISHAINRDVLAHDLFFDTAIPSIWHPLARYASVRLGLRLSGV